MCDTSVVGMYAPPSNGPDATPSTNNDGDQHQRRRKTRARMADCHLGWGDNDLTTIELVESLSESNAMRDGKNE